MIPNDAAIIAMEAKPSISLLVFTGFSLARMRPAPASRCRARARGRGEGSLWQGRAVALAERCVGPTRRRVSVRTAGACRVRGRAVWNI
jgi:hypothetical protein